MKKNGILTLENEILKHADFASESKFSGGGCPGTSLLERCLLKTWICARKYTMPGYSKRIDKQECSCTYLKMNPQLHRSIEIDHSFLFFGLQPSMSSLKVSFSCPSDSGTISQYLRFFPRKKEDKNLK